MTDSDSENSGEPLPEAHVVRKKSLPSPIWLVPFIALVIGGWLVYQHVVSQGPTITITFPEGSGLKPGAVIQYRGVRVGEVKEVDLDRSLEHVKVIAQLDLEAESIARKQSRFWVVKPRLGLTDISGLSTITSGTYIEVIPGDLNQPVQHIFTGLTEPPVLAGDNESLGQQEKNLTINLQTSNSRSVSVGAPVLYLGFEVGKISEASLDRIGDRIQLQAIIREKYRHLVRKNSVFWNISGIETKLDFLTPVIDIGSLDTLVRGGIAFTTQGEWGREVKDGEEFTLHSQAPQSRPPGMVVYLTAAELGSVQPGTAIYHRGVAVGKVQDAKLIDNGSRVQIEALIEKAHTNLVNSATVFWNVSGVTADLNLAHPRVRLESLLALVAGGIALATPPGKGEPIGENAQFELHSSPPSHLRFWLDPERDGLELIFVSDTLGSVSSGSPLLYRQVEVGEVIETHLTMDGKNVAIRAVVKKEFQHLVNSNSVFWNASGIRAELSPSPSVQIESLKSVLAGGIAFATEGIEGPPVDTGTVFALYPERPRAEPQDSVLAGLDKKANVIIKNVTEITGNVARITGQVATRKGLNGLTRTLSSIEYVTTKLQLGIDEILNNVSGITFNLLELSQKLSANPSRTLVGQ